MNDIINRVNDIVSKYGLQVFKKKRYEEKCTKNNIIDKMDIYVSKDLNTQSIWNISLFTSNVWVEGILFYKSLNICIIKDNNYQKILDDNSIEKDLANALIKYLKSK